MPGAHYEVVGKTAVITFDNPPVNGLGFDLRHAIVTLVDRAQADDNVVAIVLTGTTRAFSGGADIREFGTPKAGQEPTLRTVIKVLESSVKPVVAAIDGVCLGGGLELALGAHYRVAATSARVGLPEVKLGILPGAGGTQRLPRLLGLEKALNMIVNGTIVSATKLADTPLFDLVVDTDVVASATAFAEKMAKENASHKRVRDLKVNQPDAEALLQVARANLAAGAKRFPAPLKCLEAVAGSVSLPFDQGIEQERQLFLQLMSSPESAALRHIFAAERAATKIPGIASDIALRPIKVVGVIGAGTMGGGITMNFLNAGIPVTMLETKQDALDRGVATIRRNYENTMKKGRLTQAQVEERMGLLSTSLDYADLAQADLVIEAVFENMDVKEQVFIALDKVMKPGAILASNTSTLDVDAIANFTKRPGDVIGLHFFSPANVMRLLEIVRGKKTADDVLATCIDLAKKIAKQPVVSGVCDGFIGNRMLHRYYTVTNDLIVEGALPQQVDKVLEDFGMAMGPFRVGDLAGIDIGWSIRKHRAAQNPDQDFSMVADKLAEVGRFGQKTSAGWYRYEPGNRKPIPDPVVTQIIEAYRAEKGVTPRKISDEEILMRCLCALVNEGAKILDEGIALRASDIDVVYLSGYGFPAFRGGPMHYAEQIGLYNIARAIGQYAQESDKAAKFWAISPLLVKRVEAGGRWA
ncbi:3-hydroxyacyl-CoA dehydrogenase NAD-binding domain-containing protein [Pusillimonas sp. ANT_WB101]|uniref:3-hydroxyacyl-CoA dehydrogenase NAD-binding domain-containing protein n=1 Tax=Pusillimonas sp. ANT_WB101 TaxID=2597356 RepID=UPI0011ED347A|nr:3-hydroxyacyl-CoA dehydrogenase NAD-binding domain-containing protein [Pusillimonas sp. ANT_WB101]KAA0911234.1 3-hydroxyacyl-CoA dehydrogenase [Pusillimonas sp. ANT_WB101]